MHVAFRAALWMPALVCAHELLVGVVPASAAAARATGGAADVLLVDRRARVARDALVVYSSVRDGAPVAAHVRGLPGDIVVAPDGARRWIRGGELWVVGEEGGGDDGDVAGDGGEGLLLPRALVLGVPIAAISLRGGARWLRSSALE
jgi:hypothetical protein